MPYAPAFQSQFGWGTPYDNQNCTMAAGAMLLDRYTLGKIVTNAPHLRELSGVGATPDGTSMTDLERAIQKGYSITIRNPGPYELWDDFENKIRSGRGAVIAGDCAYVRGQARCPAGLARNHALYVNSVDEDGTFVVYDPAEHDAARGILTLTRAVLRTYAGNWAAPGMVNAGYTRVTVGEGGVDIPDDGTHVPGLDILDLPRKVAAFGVIAVLGVGGVLVLGAALMVWWAGRSTDRVMDEVE